MSSEKITYTIYTKIGTYSVMQIYSETIFAFVNKCEVEIKNIIQEETPYKFGRSRIHIFERLYPISVSIFCDSNKLGFFDPETYRIGLNQSLMYTVKDNVLKDIIRHELAHFICYALHGEQDYPHGETFKSVCRRLGWDQSISKASLDIKKANETIGNLESEKVIIRIKKLLELANSDNEYESELATKKANQLLLKYNLANIETEQDFTYIDCVYSCKRFNTTVDALYKILGYFMVKPLIVHKKSSVAIEVTGKKENIELARYICEYLDREFERLWKQRTELKGLRAKNSFIAGLALGYEKKMQQNQRELSPGQAKALTIHYNKLEEIQNRIHKKLSKIGRSRRIDQLALEQGKRDGHNLTINKALKRQNKNNLLLTWRKNA